ncbi:hypothetical protein P153DRAFT_169752 [Dothidotthia symphoricarpi CBS 119687]|uniref:CENP-V/GFA domain-containing protein n=1 Tax=Dothidotthia symphoricarpi CBS 119687 TaxID=1392245 RepID=A0A6A6ALJ5_9PLEO|nr:uncharacterized protein P153DRAFT_169752 [Dothidotthia symphoricarpi CBS 119687]KAF2132680.1 hypothetical protein P153DRAFT_169752 [Dothidotthia symphoricarpi CBS 119687]
MATETSKPTTSEPVEMETYKGSCHCASHTYTILHPALTHPSTRVLSCNCSICIRSGALFIYPPNSAVQFTTGKLEDLKAYTFTPKRIAHYFCDTCGTYCMARSVDPTYHAGTTCVNVRTLGGVEIPGLCVKEMDGANCDVDAEVEKYLGKGR